MDEFQLIRRIERELSRAAAPDARVIVNIGDDAAVVLPDGDRVVATTDSLVENVHFRWDWCTPADVGYKSVAVNLSDLAAMGARPLALLLSLCLPRSGGEAMAVGIATGVGKAARAFGVRVVGGNVSAIDGPCVVTVTALGEPVAAPVLRSGAQVGDRILVSGRPGEAALGLAVLRSRPDRVRAHARMVQAFRRPRPDIELGARLAVQPGVHALIDVSDGLLADLGHILAASRVGARIDAETLPVSAAMRRCGREVDMDVVDASLSGGEDYVLLVCVDPVASKVVQELGMTDIGAVTNRKGRMQVREDGRTRSVAGRGYRHFT